MKNSCLIAVLLLMLGSHTYAQKEADSLKTALARTHNAADSASLIKQIGIAYLKTQVPENEKFGLECFEKSIQIANRIKDKKLWVQASLWKGIYFIDRSEKSKADSMLSEVIKVAHAIKDTADELHAIVKRAMVYMIDHHPQALPDLNKALELSMAINDSNSMAGCWLQLGIYYSHVSDYKKAVQYNFLALKLAEKKRQ